MTFREATRSAGRSCRDAAAWPPLASHRPCPSLANRHRAQMSVLTNSCVAHGHGTPAP